MDLNEIIARFSRLTGLTGEPLEEQSGLCADVMAQLEARRNRRPLSPEGKQLCQAAAAAMACRRHLLSCIAAGGSLTIGDARVGEGGPVAAAAVLEAQCLQAAAPWLTPSFVFAGMGG